MAHALPASPTPPSRQLLANVKVSMIYVIRLDKTRRAAPQSDWIGLGTNIARGQSQAGGISARSHNNIIVGNIL